MLSERKAKQRNRTAKRSRGEKCLADEIGVPVNAMRIATGEIEEVIVCNGDGQSVGNQYG